MIKQEAALDRVHSNLSQYKLMLEHYLLVNIKSGIFLYHLENKLMKIKIFNKK